MIRLPNIVLCLFLSGSSMFAKSADLGNFPYVKNLAPENNSEHALGSFRLDLDVFDKSSADFSDLRIIDDTGTEIPFLIRAVTGSGAIITNRVVDFDQKQDNRKTIIEFKSRREPVRGIKIFTAEPNFSRQVLVEGQDSSGNYRTYMRGTCSFVKVGDVERDNRTLSLPTTARCSAWRLTIDNKDNPELQVTDITVITKEYEAVKGERDSLLTENEHLRKRLDETITELENLRSKYGTEKQELLAEIERLKADRETFKNKVNKLSEMVKELEEKRDELSKLLHEKEEIIEKVNNELKVSKEQIVELKKQIDIEKQENTQLKSKISELEESLNKIAMERESILQELEAIKNERDKLKQQIIDMAEKAVFVEGIPKIMKVIFQESVQYRTFRIFSEKVAAGQYRISAEELGYRFGEMSVGAWLKRYYGDLEKAGIVKIEIESTGKFPKGWVEVTDKGKEVFTSKGN